MSELKIKEMFDFSEEVNMTISMFESMAYEKQINIKYYVEENIKLNGNKEDIKQVLSVLLDNAIMHTKPNGQIIVKAVKEKNNILLQVKNEGDPIPDEEKEKIFERFYRVDKSRNRKEKRYGLGLAIAKSIVEQYKGKIDVNCKDGITTFSITLQSL
jgi:signal transduction histidine kinase